MKIANKFITLPILTGLWGFLLSFPVAGLLKALLIGALFFTLSFMPHFGSFLKLKNLQIEKRLANFINQSVVKSISLIAVLILSALFPFFGNPYLLDVANNACIYAILALGLNIAVGMAGILVLGYAAFYALGAYTYALLNTNFHIPIWFCLPIGGLVASIFALILGVPTLRLRGDYLAIVTLGFGEVTRISLNNLDSLTGGPNGILGIDSPSILSFSFSDPKHYYFLFVPIVAFMAIATSRLNASRLGRALSAIREDETAAISMGIDTTRLKLLALILSAFWAGLAGCLFAGKQLFVSPESFSFLESVMVLCMVILGGMGSIPGVIIGAILLTFLPELLRGLAEYRMLLFGIAMILLMRFRPQGLFASSRRAMEFKEFKE